MKSQSFARRNLALEHAIVDSPFTQREIAQRTSIDETRLSRIKSGTARVFPHERRALARVLRRSQRALFPMLFPAKSPEAVAS